MYPCRVEKRIWQEPERTSGYTRLHFVTETDSVPEIGLELQDGLWYSGPLKFVIWDLDNERFVCRVEDEYPVYDGDCDYSYEWIVDNYMQQGWRVDEA